MNSINLNGGWFLRELGGSAALKAAVPGDINAALVAAGKMPDPRYDVAGRECYWVSGRAWELERLFETSSFAGRARLRLEGVDGSAEIFLNGERLGEARNAFHPYLFDVTDSLRVGENALMIRFSSIDGQIGPREGELAGWPSGRALLRKPQFNFGWDWALPLPSLGIAGGVWLETGCEYEIEDISVSARADGRVDFAFAVSEAAYEAGWSIDLEVSGGGEVHTTTIARAAHRAYARVTIDSPRQWLPNGMGERTLYDYRATLFVGGAAAQTLDGRFGLRDIAILEEPFTEEAGPGYSFWLTVNGRRAFMKGGNWVPLNLWPAEASDDDYRYYLKMAAEAGFNMLRVWGGGIYERDIFYDLCDELGIMVWQDFMFASGGYPIERLRDEVVREADYQIRRLRSRACLALWCGCNEDWYSWGYKSDVLWRAASATGAGQAASQADTGDYARGKGVDRKKDDPALYTMLLRGLAGRYSPNVPFIESSPMSRDDAGNLPMSGNCHISAWKYSLFETGGHYENWRGHFERVCSCDSEFCIQGPCSKRLLSSFLAPEHLWPPCEAWIYHIQRGHANLPHYEQTMMIAGATFGAIDSLGKYVKHGQATHLEMMRAEFESARYDYPNNGGTMMWMFNDCWPTSNWSIIDYSRAPKPSYYAAKRASAPLLPILFARAGLLRAAASNHSPREVKFSAIWGQARFDGQVSREDAGEAVAAAGETVEFARFPLADLSGDCDYCYLDVVADGAPLARAVYFPNGWRDIKLPEPAYSLAIAPAREIAGGWALDIDFKAGTFVRLAHLAYIDAGNAPLWSDNYFDVTRGETRRVTASFARRPDTALIKAGDWFSEWD